MADLVLRVSRVPSDTRASRAVRRRCPAAAEAPSSPSDTNLRIRLLERVGIAGAADKRTKQYAIGGRTIRPFRREPRASHDAGVLDLGHDEPGPVQWMRDRRRGGTRARWSRPTSTESHRTTGTASGSCPEGSRPPQTPVRRARPRAHRRRSPEPVSMRNVSPSLRIRETGVRTRMDPAGRVATSARTMSLKPPGSDLNAPSGDGFRAGWRRNARSKLPYSGLLLDESRKQRPYRQAVDVAGVNASEQRFSQISRRLGTKSPRHECANRFVPTVATRGNEELGTHASFASPREQTRS